MPNIEFFKEVLENIKTCFVSGILPELVGKWYSRKPIAGSSERPFTSKASTGEELPNTEEMMTKCGIATNPALEQ